MSQFSRPAPPSSSEVPASSNGLGLAGFITSLVGLAFTIGLLCPVGLILSLIALTRRPRGFAVAGVVIGAIGTCGGCLILVPLLAVVSLAGLAAVSAAVLLVLSGGPQGLETLDHMLQVDAAITAYQTRTGAPPTDLGQLSLPADLLKDGWGRPIEYRLEGGPPTWKWSIRSAGVDGVMDGDDLTFNGSWSAPANP